MDTLAPSPQPSLGISRLAEFQRLQPAQETESVPDLDPTGHGYPDNTPNRVNLAFVGGSVIMQARGPDEPQAPQQVTIDSVPSGEVEVHRELTVLATDGEIGQIQGLVVEPGGHHVTHVLLQKGHMWP
jgi:hypothetical protein